MNQVKDELYRSKAIRLIEHGIVAASAMESQLRREQEALIAQDIDTLQAMVAEKRDTIEQLAGFESEIMALLQSVDGNVAADNWVVLVQSLYPDDLRVASVVDHLRENVSRCHALTVENESLVNLGLARVSMAMQILNGDASPDVYNSNGRDSSQSRGTRNIVSV